MAVAEAVSVVVAVAVTTLFSNKEINYLRQKINITFDIHYSPQKFEFLDTFLIIKGKHTQ